MEIVVPPEYELFAVRVRVPAPTFCNASVPPLFWITPEKALETLLLPTRNVLAPALALSVPLPLRPLTVSLEPARSKVAPLLTVRSLLPAPSGITSLLPRASVPALTRVAPE